MGQEEYVRERDSMSGSQGVNECESGRVSRCESGRDRENKQWMKTVKRVEIQFCEIKRKQTTFFIYIYFPYF